MELYILSELPKQNLELNAAVPISDKYLKGAVSLQRCAQFGYNDHSPNNTLTRPEFMERLSAMGLDPEKLDEFRFHSMLPKKGDAIIVVTKEGNTMQFVTGVGDFWTNYVCEECFSSLMGCDEEHEHKDYVAKMLLTFPIIQHDPSRDDEFSHKPCDCCGTHLHGKRYTLICQKEEELEMVELNGSFRSKVSEFVLKDNLVMSVFLSDDDGTMIPLEITPGLLSFTVIDKEFFRAMKVAKGSLQDFFPESHFIIRKNTVHFNDRSLVHFQESMKKRLEVWENFKKEAVGDSPHEFLFAKKLDAPSQNINLMSCMGSEHLASVVITLLENDHKLLMAIHRWMTHKMLETVLEPGGLLEELALMHQPSPSSKEN